MTSSHIRRETLPSGLRLVTESTPHVRSVSLGVWLTRGSRHEPPPHTGVAHFVEHMLFKGTGRRSAEAIAQEVDSIGGQLDAFTSKEYAGYYIKVLDEHLAQAVDVLSDLVINPTFPVVEIEREKKVILEEIKMVEDTPDDLVHELFAERFWRGHALGRPILGTSDTVSALTQPVLRKYFTDTYVPANFIVVAVGNLDHDRVRELVERAFGGVTARGGVLRDDPPVTMAGVQVKVKDLEQSHVCLGAPGLPQCHDARYDGFVLNTVLGGSMSSRLFQNVREKRGLAYAVFSGMSAYRDTGSLSIYAGCANDAVAELIDVVIAEVRRLRHEALPADELRRAKDHLKGSLMLNLESTSSRMSHLARQELYDDHTEGLDGILAGIEGVTAEGVQRLAGDLFQTGRLGVTVLGAVGDLQVSDDRLVLD